METKLGRAFVLAFFVSFTDDLVPHVSDFAGCGKEAKDFCLSACTNFPAMAGKTLQLRDKSLLVLFFRKEHLFRDLSRQNERRGALGNYKNFYVLNFTYRFFN